MDSSSGNGIFTQADLGCTISRKTELVDAHHDPAKTALTYRGWKGILTSKSKAT